MMTTTKLSSGFLGAVKFCMRLERPDADISGLGFVPVSFLLPVVIYVDRSPEPLNITGANSYLDTVHFKEGGIDCRHLRQSQLKALLSGYSDKRYLPIIRFPAADGEHRDSIIASVENLLHRQAGYGHNIEIGVKYIISETIDNIAEHSGSPVGFIVAQSYDGFTDVCIADVGRTILGGYRANGRTSEISSDMEAIQAATEGLSSKNRPDAENRGFGIRTTQKMLIQGLGGEYLLASGGAVFATNRQGAQYLELPPGMRLEGTFSAFRIPHNVAGFNYMQFVE